MRWWLLLASLQTQAAASPPSAPSAVVPLSETPPSGYVLGQSEGSCAGAHCVDENAGYSLRPAGAEPAAVVSAAGRFTTRMCYDVRQILSVAAQVPNADGSWKTCRDLAKIGASHPAARSARGVTDRQAATRQRRWYEKHMAAQLRDLLRSTRPTFHVIPASHAQVVINSVWTGLY